MADGEIAPDSPVECERGAALPRGIVALQLIESWRAGGRPGLLYVCDGQREAEYLGAAIHALVPESSVMVFPRWDCLPYDPAGPSREIMGRRSSVLRRLAAGIAAPLVVVTPEALLQRVPPRRVWARATRVLRRAEAAAFDELRDFLQCAGYRLEPVVDEPGEAALHGQTADIFPAGALGPVRVQVEDGRIAAIETYDPATQRSVAELDEVILDPATEAVLPQPHLPEAEAEADTNTADTNTEVRPWLSELYCDLETLFDYMPEVTTVVGRGARDRTAAALDQIREGYESAMALPPAFWAEYGRSRPPIPDRLFCKAREWQRRLQRARAHDLTPPRSEPVPRFAVEPHPTRAYRAFIAEQIAAGRRVVLAAGELADLRRMARQAEAGRNDKVRRIPDWQDVTEARGPAIFAFAAEFETGFVLPDAAVALIAAADLLGSRTRHRMPMALPRGNEAAFDETMLQIGRPVVHLDHGIGMLRGIETVAVPDGPAQDTLRLEFAGGAGLMVPMRDIGKVWGYGTAAGSVRLDRLSGEEWQLRRSEIEAAIGETAQALTALARERQNRKAAKLAPSARAYERFAAGFPFVLTPDQGDAIENVLADLASGQPMDRLLCGDVGFGKTEVALRAVAAAVLSGKQAAIVAPTTVLARQHLNTFRRRFSGFGVRVEMLSRLVKAAEVRRIKEGLRDGMVQIVIGTHALAGQDIRFHDLGLLVIDEEQRFGARGKEQLRGSGDGRHVLTMTATPIPRTLQRALVGLQSLSTLETPPARRLPIRTMLRVFDPALLRQALLYERRRGGQSFVVCPRIADLGAMSGRLQQIVPELQVVPVHGKLPASQVDEAIVAFAEGRGDILLTTNIIETGLDIPRANTILIWRPERFGAAQLHQLRGRVGRGRRRGLAFLLTDPDAPLPSATQRRLSEFAAADALGAGFMVSRRDLDRRGAGELLGDAQAGHMRLVGAELYANLLGRALAEAGGHAPAERAEVQLDLSAFIPADYIPEPELRINLYARLGRAAGADIEELAEEIEDRFGPVPPAVRNLLAMTRIAETAGRLGVAQLDAGPTGVALTFGPVLGGRRRTAPRHEPGFHWAGDRLVIERSSAAEERVEVVLELLHGLPSPV